MKKHSTQKRFVIVAGAESTNRHRKIAAAAAALLGTPLLLGRAALAADTWIGASGGSWTDNTKWNSGMPPNGSTAVFNLGSATGYTVSVPSSQSVGELDVDTDTTTLNLAATATLGTGSYNAEIGSASGQNGFLTLTGSGVYSPAQVFVGTNGGVGVLNSSGELTGGFLFGGLVIGAGTNSQGSFSDTDGNLGTNESINLNVYVGVNGGTGTANFSAEQFSSQPANLDVGADGTGTVSLTNGSNISVGALTVGATVAPSVGGLAGSLANPSGLLTIDHSSLSVYGANGVQIGEVGSIGVPKGTVILTNGGSLSSGVAIHVGATSAATGTPMTGTLEVLSGSSVNPGVFHNGQLTIGAEGGTGSVRVSGVNSVLYAANINVGTDGSVGGTGTLQVDNGGVIESTGGELKVAPGGTLNVVSGGTLTVGVMALTSAGAVNLSGGTISVNGAIYDPSLVLPNTATLAGTAYVYGNLTSDGLVVPDDGRLAPGVSTGNINVQGNYTQNADGVLNIGIAPATGGDTYSNLSITGAAALNGTLEITLLDGYVPSVGQQFDILSFGGSESGAFLSVQLPTLPGGEYWDSSRLYSSGILSVVPEPASGALVFAGAALLAARRRRRA